MRRRLVLALVGVLAIATPTSAQIVAGQLPQLPTVLGPNGGMRVECIQGCAGGPGSGLTDAELRASPVNVSVIGTVTFSNTSIAVTNAGTFAVQAAQSGTWNIGTLTSITNPVAVTGTFWPGTQPVDGSGVTQPVSAVALPLPAGASTSALQTTGNTSLATIAGAVAGAEMQVDVLTLPSVTIGTFPDNEPINVAQINGVAVTMGNGASGTGVQRVTLASDSPVPVSAFPDNEPFNVAQVGGAAVSTAASGVQKVGMVGNAGAAFDAANNAAAPANVEVIGLETIAIASAPTAATTGNVRRQLATVEGVAFAREGSSQPFSCFVALTATATTQCQAAPAAGLRAYVTSFNGSNGAATVQGIDIVYGTGAACATGITALTHKFQMGTNGLTTSPIQLSASFPTPLVPVAANAICLRPTAATAFGGTLTGFIAP